MTPGEKNIVKSLVAVAWADGKLEDPESGVIDGLLSGFDASEAEEQEIFEYARHRRNLEHDLPLNELNDADRELLLSNAALLTHADGHQSERERRVLHELAERLGFGEPEAEAIIQTALGARAPTPF